MLEDFFYKALDNVSFRPHIIYSAFVQFEREEGNRSDLDNALERVNLLASKIREEDIQQQKRKRKQDGKQQQNEREKGNFKRAAKVPKVERKGGRDINSKETSLPQKTKQGKLDLLKNEEQMDIDNTNLIENSITKTTTFETCNVPIGPIIPQINNQNNEKITITKREEVREDLQKQQSSAFPYSTSLEKNKLFVKHLHFGCKEDELKDLFSKFGNVLDVRIITKWNGRSKGCAYVDFEKDSEASAAVLGANGALIRGKQIEVYLSNPSIKKREKPMEAVKPVKPSTSSDKNEGNISTKKEHKKPQNSLNFIPRAAQRIGKASRLDLSTNISKNLNNGENIK
ncbi:RRM domain-containing protein [Meloidogyne graminicola]|uniref:RRM domain-containing protein n=1 Tax=Meloidogyne graminicola TaxID=189291 RepID=A0A8S9ZQQ5_9BILA|nr:RRM domain-containing protein [Meloidogyne graminicola]